MCEWGRERRNREEPPGRSSGASGMIMLGTLLISIGILGLACSRNIKRDYGIEVCGP
jgi:hypothetical protein